MTGRRAGLGATAGLLVAMMAIPGASAGAAPPSTGTVAAGPAATVPTTVAPVVARPGPTAPPSFTTDRATAGQPTVTVKVGDLRREPAELSLEKSCWYRRGLVMGPSDVRFVHPDIQPLSAGDLMELGYEDSRPELQELLDDVTVYAIPPDLDPLQAAINMGNGAAPVLMAGYAIHWGFAPGGPPVDHVALDGKPTPSSELFDALPRPQERVGVIDTGYLDLDAPWPADRITAPTSRDLEPGWIDPDLAGHGMFVASTILQRNPTTEVSVARAGLTELSAFEPHPASARADWWYDHSHVHTESATDELQMFFAVQRLLDAGGSYAALNISMGTYLCDQLAHSGLAVRAAMARWHDHQPKAPVVAAAGNHETHQPPAVADFVPADLELAVDPLGLLPVAARDSFDVSGLDLTAVAALDHEGTGLADYSNYKPHDVLAVGTDVLAVRDGQWITAWSGTSFATPVVTGAIVAGESPVGDVYDLGPVRQLP